MSEKKEAIVTNESEGYGYKYAALSDIAKQGFEIPMMKTDVNPINQKEYVWFYDKQMKAWIQGAQVVVPESKGMNAAQLYGSALTYARRYTVFLALGLASEDDRTIEEDLNPRRKATEKQIEMIVRLYDSENIAKMLQYYQIQNLEDLTMAQASEVIDRKRKSK